MAESVVRAMTTVTIYSRQGCHLCAVVHRIARHLQEEVPFRLDYVDIAANRALSDRYGDQVPVVLIDGREILRGKMTEGQLRRAVKRARWRSPISRILFRVKLALMRR